MNIEHINAPETGCTPEEQAAWHAGIEAGREIERNNIAAQAQPDAGLDVEAVLRQFLTGDGFIAECDIQHIVAALTAQPAASAENATCNLQLATQAPAVNANALLYALRQIAEWPDGGNRYGQANIKRFAQDVIDAALAASTGQEV